MIETQLDTYGLVPRMVGMTNTTPSKVLYVQDFNRRKYVEGTNAPTERGHWFEDLVVKSGRYSWTTQSGLVVDIVTSVVRNKPGHIGQVVSTKQEMEDLIFLEENRHKVVSKMTRSVLTADQLRKVMEVLGIKAKEV